MQAFNQLAPEVGLAPACAALNLNRSSVYREDARRRLLVPATVTLAARPPAPLALSADERAALEPHKRGRKADPAQAEDRRVLQLTQENDRLRRKLAQANAIIDVQKKLCALLGLPADETPSECC